MPFNFDADPAVKIQIQSHLLKEGILEMEVPDIPDKDKIVTLQVTCHPPFLKMVSSGCLQRCQVDFPEKCLSKFEAKTDHCQRFGATPIVRSERLCAVMGFIVYSQCKRH